MNTFDLSPLYRSSVGFDRLFSLLDSSSNRAEKGHAYPPYNIERIDENNYSITMAVAGFSEENIEITSEQNNLSIVGSQKDDTDQKEYLYRGIAARSFERRFQLADHVKVKGAGLENGILNIALEREIPEAMKPKSIPIAVVNKPFIEGKSSKAA